METENQVKVLKFSPAVTAKLEEVISEYLKSLPDTILVERSEELAPLLVPLFAEATGDTLTEFGGKLLRSLAETMIDRLDSELVLKALIPLCRGGVAELVKRESTTGLLELLDEVKH